MVRYERRAYCAVETAGIMAPRSIAGGLERRVFLAKKGGEERGAWAMVRYERRAFCAVETAGIMTPRSVVGALHIGVYNKRYFKDFPSPVIIFLEIILLC